MGDGTEDRDTNLKIARLLDALVYPNSEGPDSVWTNRGIEVLEGVPTPQPARPWKGAWVAKVEIDRMIGLSQILSEYGVEQRYNIIASEISNDLDDFCGTPPKPPRRRWPWPFPPQWDKAFNIGPADLVVMGAQFYKAAENLGDPDLKKYFDNAASRLFDTGLERLASASYG